MNYKLCLAGCIVLLAIGVVVALTVVSKKQTTTTTTTTTTQQPYIQKDTEQPA